jgi:hypothetical protein
MRFHRPVAGYGITDHKSNEDIKEALGKTIVNVIIKNYTNKWLQHLERISESRIPKLRYQYKQKGRRWQGCPKMKQF